MGVHSKVASVLIAIFALGGIVLQTSSAHAQQVPANKIDGVRADIHVSVGPGLGLGVDIEIPVVPEGWLQGRIEDEFVLVPGAEFFFVDFHDEHFHGGHHHDHDHTQIAFGPKFSARWNVYVHEEWSVFPELGFTLIFADNHFGPHEPRDDQHDDIDVYGDPVIGGGARWHFNSRGALTMKLVYPWGFQFGIAF